MTAAHASRGGSHVRSRTDTSRPIPETPSSSEARAATGNQAVTSLLASFLRFAAPAILTLSLCPTRTAHASCAMAIDGDPDAVTDIEAALYSFGQDEVPCVAVRVLCSRDADQFVVDLHDQLGRAVQRRFSTAAGAAAFVISWSRRPLPQDGTQLTQLAPAAPAPPALAPPALAPPALAPRAPLALTRVGAPSPITETAAEPERSPTGVAVRSGRHGELHAAYLPSGGRGFIVEGALVRHSGIWQYGGVVRTVASWPDVRHSLDNGSTESMWFLTDAEAVVRAQWAMDRLIVRGEVAAGAGVLALWTDIASTPYFQTLGARGGARAMLLTPLVSSLYLEAAAGTEFLLATYTTATNNALAMQRLQVLPHAEIGLLWEL